MTIRVDSPEEDEVESYLLTNIMGETHYAYWKTIWEEIREEKLVNDYKLENVSLANKGEPVKVVEIDDSFEDEMSIILKPIEVHNLTIDRVKNKCGRVCFDDLDLLKVSKRLGLLENQYRVTPQALKKSIFVPISICIKTANPYTDQAKELLNSLITSLLNNKEKYTTNLHNLIYNASEFCSYILALTHVNTPPPFAELIIPIANKEIVYYEELISNIPCDGDMSIAYLFSLIPIEHIVLLWTALLLEKDVILYIPNVNIYFFLAKALIQLMFPLSWHYTKGVITSLGLLHAPTPYCYGILNSRFTITQINEKLKNYKTRCVILTIDSEKKTSSIEGMKDQLKYPYRQMLMKDLASCCLKNGIKVNGILPSREVCCVYFAKEVQAIFFKELQNFLMDFDYLVKMEETIEKFREKYVEKFMNTKCRSNEEVKFVEKLIETQAIASFYDEATRDKQSHYAIMQAINVSGKYPPMKLLRIHLRSTRKIIFDRLLNLVDLIGAAKQANSRKGIENKTIFTKSIAWEEEINKMKALAQISNPIDYIEIPKIDLRYNKRKKSVTSSFLFLKIQRSEKKSNYIEIEELKVKDKYKFEVLDLSNVSSKQGITINQNTIEFYGIKGIFAFLNEFMSLDYNLIQSTIVLDEEKNVLDYYKRLSSQSTEIVKEDEDHSIEYLKGSSEINKELLFLEFSSINSLQFLLFMAYFYLKYYKDIIRSMGLFLEAFKYIDDTKTYRSFFPINTFKQLIRELPLEELRKLLRLKSKLAFIINEVYKEKADNYRFNEDIEDDGSAGRSPSTPKAKSSFKTLKTVKSSSSNIISLKKEATSISKFAQSFINDYRKIPSVRNGDPNSVIYYALKDLVELLKLYKPMGQEVFKEVGKSSSFKVVLQQAAVLRVILSSH